MRHCEGMGRGAISDLDTPHGRARLHGQARRAANLRGKKLAAALLDDEQPGERTREVAAAVMVSLGEEELVGLRSEALAALASQALVAGDADSVRTVRLTYRALAAALIAPRCTAQGHELVQRLTAGALPQRRRLRRSPKPPSRAVWEAMLRERWSAVPLLRPSDWSQLLADHYGLPPTRWRGPQPPRGSAAPAAGSSGHDEAQALLAAGIG